METFKKVAAIRGMNDVLPDASGRWERLEQLVRDWLRSYGYANLRTPVLEHTRLFTRGIGEVTDIVEKEMYTFTDSLNGESLTLRPEFTAGMVRATIEHNLLYDRPRRVYAMGPVFRHERPQRGRYRQFHQIDVEALGFAGPDVDAEQILMLARLWRILGLADIRLEINSLGAGEERLAHRQALIAYLEQHADILDEDGRRRLYTNPLRVLDTKNPALQEMAAGAPRLLDFLGESSRAHFDGLRARLDDAGVAYRINPRLVRGLDYYNLTVFEWVTDRLGAQGTVCGGGRYDGLLELVGGKPAPAVGFAIGMERLLDLWEQTGDDAVAEVCDVYVAHLGDAAARQALLLGESLRDAGLDVVVHGAAGSFKSQMKRADACRAAYAVILGDTEVAERTATVKNLADGEQQKIAFERLADVLVDALAAGE
ncbi:histidine--tRNA ligase [Verticiella sediminum]|uniref:Histidine--tRNA ligase n=1 Tax=Verticiella sediminum TaxID=1247510 RepID=A0A556ADS7_9BURK|nr:histidine--tRNA ligase [Verticiella sediminum]TSH91048.1 histidine--tRNA ligase [Verticiella sediminum]